MRKAAVSVLILLCFVCPGGPSSYGQTQSGSTETVGIGVQDPSITNETQRRATAREAALTQAQAKMLFILHGRSSVSPEEQEELKAGILRGAYVVNTEWISDGSCRVTLRINAPGSN